MEIVREIELSRIHAALQDNPVVAIVGPRQCGKTTLAKQFLRMEKLPDALFLDCEDPRDLTRLDNPMLALESAEGLVVIDEIQRRPELFPALRVLGDGDEKKRFLILGSASPDLLSQSSETLAGRITFLELRGFGPVDVPPGELDSLWIRGGFPRSFLARSDRVSFQWRMDFVRTFLERDVPQLGFNLPARLLRRFWTMLAHSHGQLFNASELGRSLGIRHTKVREYLDIMTGAFLIRQLQPWYYNTRKRLVKRPKVYFRDTGLLHALLALGNRDDVLNHPRLGASWEGFALEQVLRHLQLTDEEACFWAVHTGAELDLVWQRKGRLWGAEFKYADAPRVTRSMRAALSELDLGHIWVFHPGHGAISLDPQVTSVGLSELSVRGYQLPGS